MIEFYKCCIFIEINGILDGLDFFEENKRIFENC